MIKFEQLTFHQLNPTLLYQVLQLRNEVFIVEQNAPYLDLDDKDFLATHFILLDKETVVAYGRVMFDNDKSAMSLGRLITRSTHRKQGLAKIIMKHMLSFLDKYHQNNQIIISAQSYLEDFYGSFGFIAKGQLYLEDGLLHVKMIKQAKVPL